MSNLALFYSAADLTDGFGATGPHRRNPHRGLDFPHSWGTEIPALVGGAVIDCTYSSALGWLIEVHGDDGMFYGYRHQAGTGVPVGTRVETGQRVGLVGDTGSASTGAHLCLTVGTAAGAVYGAPALVTDPWPYVKAALLNALTAPTKRSRKMMIRDEDGSIFVIDEMGADHLGDFRTADIELKELIDTGSTLYGAPTQVNNRQRDLLLAIASRRAARHRAQQAEAIAAAMRSKQ